ncbi:hypothetical protein AArcSl_3194 [Halalkaliarchaeum desulfuricum]|uniref:Methyltransferase domain-containing protein n=1 Tax=Halalkaliarchaeum desulfuricum TaxID=2055893 RepID=A0A343TNX8_9EURY|nr:methyltransferase domain-containing protein [Halalkaliarchaeum desulfuricum]AUX10800.1 hypothetical protein AArcSl_3194 [Halalkaliarchaeum desulfuricum]
MSPPSSTDTGANRGVLKHVFAGLEQSFASLPWLFELLVELYRPLVRREMAIADVDASDRVLAVGCGALPYTAALIAECSRATVYALDCDRDAIADARRTLTRSGSGARIELVAGDGAQLSPTSLDVDSLDVAFVAVQAGPKTEIVDHLRSVDCGPDRIVVRRPRPAFAAAYGSLPDGYEPIDSVAQPAFAFGRSALFDGRKTETLPTDT